MRFLASPRRRRRLAWVTLALGVVGLFLGVNALLPSHGPPKGIRVVPRAPVLGASRTVPSIFEHESPAAIRARQRAEATVHPLANAFVTDLLRRRRLAQAFASLAPSLRSRYVLADWQHGRDLPLPANRTATPFSSVSFSGPTTVGLVAAISPSSVGSDTTLLALRFEQTRGSWLIDYLHRGHTSSRTDASNYAPGGFLPGTHQETVRTWAILVGGFLGLVIVVALVSRGLRGTSLG